MSFVPNLLSPLVDKLGKVIPPWNSFFQQFTQKAVDVQIFTSPFTSNTQGFFIFTGVAPSIILTRGITIIDMTGQKLIPVAVGDTLVWTGSPTVQFLGTFSK